MEHPSNRPTSESLDSLFTYHPPTASQKVSYEEIRRRGLELAGAILDHCPPCADTSAAVRKVREAVMTANAAIATAPKEG